MIVADMTRAECIDLLSSSRLGRIACSRAGVPYVVPMHFAYADNCIFSFSLPGQKIDWMRENPNVCVQVDHFDQNRQWSSVVAHGQFEELPDRIGTKLERDHAWKLLERHANWWEPGDLKPLSERPTGSHLFYRIRIETLSGRRAVDAP